MPKVLVAEDDSLAGEALTTALSAAGLAAVLVSDGEAALQSIKTEHPDILVLDVAMPKLDGVSVLWELRAAPDTEKLPVLVLTNMSDMDTIGKILQAGIVDYLVKGENSVDQVVDKVKEILARKAAPSV